MKIEFTKMHGLGNDFIVIDAINQDVRLSEDQIRFLADRHFGIGCDQLLLVERPSHGGVEFRYRIFNADGGEVEQCGNGARCFARFVHDQGLTNNTEIPVETNTGDIVLHIKEDDSVSVDMGRPRFKPGDLPFLASQSDRYLLELNNENLEIGAVSMGNPHAVTLVKDIESAPVEKLGPLVESHALFPRRVNAGFMQIIDRGHIRLRVYERGAGETLACGTGACAAMVVGRQWGLLDETVDVQLPGGHLSIYWPGEQSNVIMSGPAERVFTGTISI